jgi:glyoxylase-like metal-dependent hydrolase (beta-lactamase superfamily II)
MPFLRSAGHVQQKIKNNPQPVELRARNLNMFRALILALTILLGAANVTRANESDETLAAAANAIGATGLTSIKYSGTGSSAMIGQGLTVGTPARWVLVNYAADVFYDSPAFRMEFDRTYLDGAPPFNGVKQRWYLKGSSGWNLAADGTPTALVPRPDSPMSSVEERQLQVQLTPQGFIKAAMANRAAVRRLGQLSIVTFTGPGGARLTGTLNRAGLVERVDAVVDNAVLGDMIVETIFSGYKSFGGVQFPTNIIQRHGGFTTLDLTVSNVTPNGGAAIEISDAVRALQPPVQRMDVQQIGQGVWYLAGGTHHSVLIEFADYLALVDAPIGETRANMVLAEARKLAPNKPVRYLIMSHSHFDHAGGIRTAAPEVSTLLTTEGSRAYWESVLKRPRTLHPDKLAQTAQRPKVEGVVTKRVLSDGARTVELYTVPIDGHVDEMILVYFPADRLLEEVDAWTPGPPNAPVPANPDPTTIQLLKHIERLQLKVDRIASLHGRMATIAELRTAAGRSGTN